MLRTNLVPMRLWLAVVLMALGGVGCAPESQQPREAQPSVVASPTVETSRVIFRDDFESDPFTRWEPVTKSAWSWTNTDHSHVFELTKNVPLEESVRAPFNRNLVKGLVVSDFQLDVDLRSTTRDYPNRDLSLMFGYQDPAHMYYCHLGHVESDTSNNIFIVDGKDRAPISTHTSRGTQWGNGWHHARVRRNVADGSIKVYFDDMKDPVMTATDKTFLWGQVGIGSFDDTGQFDNVSVRGIRAARPSASPTVR
jgi:hypothetical protein